MITLTNKILTSFNAFKYITQIVKSLVRLIKKKRMKTQITKKMEMKEVMLVLDLIEIGLPQWLRR